MLKNSDTVLYIYNGSKYIPLWEKFRDYVYSQVELSDIGTYRRYCSLRDDILESYNSQIFDIVSVPYIKFDTKEDKLLFLLKWS